MRACVRACARAGGGRNQGEKLVNLILRVETQGRKEVIMAEVQQCSALCDTAQDGTVQYNAVQCSAVHDSEAQCMTVKRSA